MRLKTTNFTTLNFLIQLFDIIYFILIWIKTKFFLNWIKWLKINLLQLRIYSINRFKKIKNIANH